MTLSEQITLQRHRIAEAKAIVDELTKDLRQLEQLRNECNHVFSNPIMGYEHEGGYCIECGINEIEAASMRRR